MRSNQNLRVFWKPVSLQDCVWANHCGFIMKTILQEKETVHYNITISQIDSYASSSLNSSSKSNSGQGLGKIGENFGVEPDKSQKQKRGDR